MALTPVKTNEGAKKQCQLVIHFFFTHYYILNMLVLEKIEQAVAGPGIGEHTRDVPYKIEQVVTGSYKVEHATADRLDKV